MKTNQITINFPDGYKAEYENTSDNIIINIVEDKPAVTYKYRIMHNGILSTTTYDTEKEAGAAMQEDDTIIPEAIPSPHASIPSPSTPASASTPSSRRLHLPIKWHWLALAIGLLLITYGLYKFILIDNETATTFSLIKIAAITIIGALITFFSLKGGEE